jgi:phosphotransferase system HPr (HPr) family protein
LRRVVKVANPQGLHVRPAAAFAELAARFESRVTLRRDGSDEVVNGKLWPELLLLSAEQGTPLVLEVDGSDAPAAIDALTRILDSIFEEAPAASNGTGHGPAESS